jgi:hypothetical protein
MIHKVVAGLVFEDERERVEKGGSILKAYSEWRKELQEGG